MSLVDPPVRTLTAEDILALPDDGIDRQIIHGQLRERPVTLRNRLHSNSEARIAKILGVWLDQCPIPRGLIHSGEVGFRLRRDPETFVGIDVAYVSAELVAAIDPKKPFYDGAPVLAVEILSPSDSQGDIAEKVGLYLEVGTVVWVVNPAFRTLTVHKPGQLTVLYNESHEFSGDPELPALRVRVADLFPEG